MTTIIAMTMTLKKLIHIGYYRISASEMTCIVSSGALNSTHSLTIASAAPSTCEASC